MIPVSSRPPPRRRLHAALRRVLACAGALCVLASAAFAQSGDGPADEYRIKAAFLVNFASFTTWPESSAETLSLCVYGDDPFGAHLDAVAGRKVGQRSLRVVRASSVDALDDCEMVFVTRAMIGNLGRVLDRIARRPVLTVADSPGATDHGVMLNMDSGAGRISFSANLAAARDHDLTLSARLLNLASEVKQ